MSENVQVQTGDHTVGLRPKLGLAAGIELQERLRALLKREPRPSQAEIVGMLTETYLLVGVAEWSLSDEMGPIPVSRENIAEHLLSDYTLAAPVADAADGLYYEPVLAPLLGRLSTSLRGGSTRKRISAANGSTPKPRKPSKRSSTTTTRTVATETTSE